MSFRDERDAGTPGARNRTWMVHSDHVTHALARRNFTYSTLLILESSALSFHSAVQEMFSTMTILATVRSCSCAQLRNVGQKETWKEKTFFLFFFFSPILMELVKTLLLTTLLARLFEISRRRGLRPLLSSSRPIMSSVYIYS